MINQIGIVIPAYEPDDRLLQLLKDLRERQMGPVYLVDDGSGSAYQSIFNQAKSMIEPLGGKILVHSHNQGKGRALKTAFEFVLQECGRLEGVVTADSDGQHTPDCIQKVMDSLANHLDALVLGVRRFDGDDIPWKSVWGNKLTEKVFQYTTGVHVLDTQTGLRGISKQHMQAYLELQGDRFEFEMKMLLYAAEHYPIVQVPIQTIYDSKENHQTHFNPVKDSLRIYRIIGERFFKYLLSSVSACALDLLLFALFCMLVKPLEPMLYIAIATVIARICSAGYNYFINYKLVFQSSEGMAGSALKYFALVLVQMMCSAALVTMLAYLLPFVPEVGVKAIVDTGLFFVSYLIQRRFVFKS